MKANKIHFFFFYSYLFLLAFYYPSHDDLSILTLGFCYDKSTCIPSFARKLR